MKYVAFGVNRQDTATFAMAQTPKLTSRSKMMSPSSIYNQRGKQSIVKNPQISPNTKENWQRYCIPTNSKRQLPQTENANVERATLPKTGKVTRETGSSGLQHQISNSGECPAKKAENRDCTQGSYFKSYMKDGSKLCLSDSNNSAKSAIQVPSVGGPRKREVCIQNISSQSLKDEKLQKAQKGDKTKSVAKGQDLSAEAYSSSGPGYQGMGQLYSSSPNANVKAQQFAERNSYEKFSNCDRKLTVSNQGGYSLDAIARANCPVTAGSGINCMPLTLNCYQHPYSGPRCTTPRHSSFAGGVDSNNSCLHYISESREIESRVELMRSNSLSAKVGAMSGRLGSTRPSSPRLLSSRDEDGNFNFLSLISACGSLYMLCVCACVCVHVGLCVHVHVQGIDVGGIKISTGVP